MPDYSRAKRVLIYRLGSLGDTVIALPSFHLIARTFPNAERRLLTNIPVAAKAAAAAAVLGDSGLVHGYFHYLIGERGLKNLLDLRREIRAWRPDAVVNLARYRGIKSLLRDWLFFRACGIKNLYGFPFNKHFRHPHKNPETNELEHASAFTVRPIAALFGEPHLDDLSSWDLHITPAEEAVAATALTPADGHPILAVCIGTKVQAKDWGVANWNALLARLAPLYPNHALVMIGAKEERDVSAQAAAGWQQNAPAESIVLNLCGQLTPRESAAVLARAKLYLGHDSGPMHLAAAVGTRCVALFAARNIPALWFPYGAPNWFPDHKPHRVIYHQVDCAGCNLETCIVQQKKCILSITVDEVLNAIAEILPPTAV